jgi:hypothetical protein
MAWRPDRVATATSRVTLALLLVHAGAACTGGGPTAGTGGISDASGGDADLPAGPDGLPAARPEARGGFVSGTGCQVDQQCLSGACALGVCSDWTHVLRIAIDTTASGANIKEPVADFPLLVRLDERYFPFHLASSDGADLRFVDSSGHTLNHEIERWDPDEGTAAIWVLVPRVESNSRDNVLLMYFGNPSAVPLSSGPAVFSKLDLVLHVTNPSGGEASRLVDSSGHANTALVQPPSAAQFFAGGIAGDGVQLDGYASYLATAVRLASPQTFSTSLWFKTATKSGGVLIAFASNQSGHSGRFDRVVWMDPEGRLSFAVARGDRFSTVRSLADYRDDTWHLLVARFSPAGQYLMVDGESVADDPTSTAVESFGGYWRFGDAPIPSPSPAQGEPAATSSFLAGVVDEIRVSSEAASDARVRLAFATEWPDGHAVTYQMVP